MRFLATLVSAAALFVAAPLLACDNHAKAADKTVAASAGTKAGKACCDAMAKALASGDAVKASNGSAECPHAKSAVLKTGSSAECPHAKSAAAKADCPLAAAPGRALKAGGKILCAACDLHQAETCKSMFQARGGETYPLCPGGVGEQLLKLTKHGEVEVTVSGSVKKAESGEMLCVDGFAVGTI